MNGHFEGKMEVNCWNDEFNVSLEILEVLIERLINYIHWEVNRHSRRENKAGLLLIGVYYYKY